MSNEEVQDHHGWVGFEVISGQQFFHLEPWQGGQKAVSLCASIQFIYEKSDRDQITVIYKVVHRWDQIPTNLLYNRRHNHESCGETRTFRTTVLPRNPTLSDHNLITFDFSLSRYMPVIKNSFSRCLPDSAIAKFKEIIPTTFKPILSTDITNKFFKNPSSTEIDHLVDSAVRSLRLTLDSIAPLKKKLVKHSKLAPWYNPKTHELKQVSRKLERKWRSNNSVEYLLDWKNSVRVYKKALHKARAAYYSKLIEENKNNPRFLFICHFQFGRQTPSVHLRVG